MEKDSFSESCGNVTIFPWFSVAVTGVVSAGKAYFNEEDAAYDDFGKALVGGTIDAIASIGPIDGELIGAKFGPKGVVIGFFGGLVIQSINILYPSWTTDVQDGAYKLVDKAREFGQSVSTTFSTIKELAGNVINKKTNKIIDRMKDMSSKIKENTKNIIEILSINTNPIRRPVLGF